MVACLPEQAAAPSSSPSCQRACVEPSRWRQHLPSTTNSCRYLRSALGWSGYAATSCAWWNSITTNHTEPWKTIFWVKKKQKRSCWQSNKTLWHWSLDIQFENAHKIWTGSPLLCQNLTVFMSPTLYSQRGCLQLSQLVCCSKFI